jgi:Acetyltransferase (GNAT) domain
VQAACRWAFTTLGTELIEWRCEVGNTASRQVAEKAGFLIEATLRKRLIHRGTRVDAWVGSILSTELTNASHPHPKCPQRATRPADPGASIKRSLSSPMRKDV